MKHIVFVLLILIIGLLCLPIFAIKWSGEGWKTIVDGLSEVCNID